MTLVRVAWGAVTAVWALTFLPDVDPFFTEGALLYERDLRDGAWNLLPHLGWEHAGVGDVPAPARHVAHDDGRPQDPAERARSRCSA